MDWIFSSLVGTALGAGALAAKRLLAAQPAPDVPPCCTPPAPEPEPPAPGPLRRLLRLWRRLFARQSDQRAWVMLLGAKDSGKSSLVASAWKAAAEAPQSPEAKLDGAVCQRFEQGVLIDTASAPTAATWRQLLDQLEDLRPRRPLDGLVLTVSATALRRPAQELDAAAAALRRQLQLIQSRYQWVLPVYVVVTGCDLLASSEAYQAATAAVPATEMIGWSAPEVGEFAGARRWSDLAFDQLEQRFRHCQLRAAATPAAAGDYQLADAAFLLPFRWQTLRAPLAAWLDAALRPVATQQGFMLRGIYFTGARGAPSGLTGKPRDDLGGVGDLISQKVLAERHLADPTGVGRSALRRWRRLLAAGVTMFASALVLVLAIATASLTSQLNQLESSLRAIVQGAAVPAATVCMDRERVAGLIGQIEHVALPGYAPWSALDHRLRDQSARQVAAKALDKVILPALACKLDERGRLLARLPEPSPDPKLAPESYLTAARQDLLGYLDKVLALEQNYARLRQLGAPNSAADPQAAVRALYELLNYAYEPAAATDAAAASGTTLPGWLAALLKTAGLDASPALSALPARTPGSGALLYQSLRHVALPITAVPPRSALQANISHLQSQLPGYLDTRLEQGAVQLAQLDKNSAQMLPPALVEGARQGYAWLSWIQTTLVPSTPTNNPCQDIASGLDQRQSALAGYGYRLGSPSGQPYVPGLCYQQLKAALSQLTLPGYGAVVTTDGGHQPPHLNPQLAAELTGFGALLNQDFMQTAVVQDFQCLRQETVWQPELIQRARNSAHDYQEFARLQSVSQAPRGRLFDRVARRQLELVIDDTLSAAQSPGAAGLGKAGLEQAGTDARLSYLSANFAKAAAPLASLAQLQQQMGMAGSASALNACVRAQAADGLAAVGELAESGRLYMPPAGPAGGPPFDLGGAANVDDYLATQIARVQVLTGYAAPYAQALQNTQPVNDTGRAVSQSAPYWNNTIRQLNQDLAKDTSGAVGKLRSLIAGQLPDSEAGPCAATTPAPAAAATPAVAATAATTTATAPATVGTDLFTARRLSLQSQLASRCDSRARAQLTKDYSALSDAFNARLAGRYPFGPLSAEDVPGAELKQFFTDYGALLSSVQARFAKPSAMSPSQPDAAQRWAAQRDFLDQLDALAKALLPGLNTGAPLRVAVNFYAKPLETQGGGQLVVWTLSSGATTIGAPNRQPGALDWPFGQAISFDLEWADRSALRPVADRTQRDLQISGTSAQFGYAGDWALLRMIELHRRPDSASAMLLQFELPVAPLASPATARPSGRTRVYLTLGLTSKDPDTDDEKPVKLPPRFPHFAPR